MLIKPTTPFRIDVSMLPVGARLVRTISRFLCFNALNDSACVFIKSFKYMILVRRLYFRQLNALTYDGFNRYSVRCVLINPRFDPYGWRCSNGGLRSGNWTSGAHGGRFVLSIWQKTMTENYRILTFIGTNSLIVLLHLRETMIDKLGWFNQ